MSLCPREELAHVSRDALCFGQRRSLFRIIAQNNSVQHTTIRSALERVTNLVVAVHGAIVEIDSALRVGCGGSCRRQGYVFGCFWRQRYVLSNLLCGCIRIVAVLVKTETHCSLIRSVGKLLSFRHTSCTCLILCRRAGRRHCAFEIICPMSL